MPHSIIIMKWAPQPFYRFMEVKELPITGVTSIDVVEGDCNGRLAVKVFVGQEGRYKVLDIEEVQMENLAAPPGVEENKVGRAVKGIVVGNENFVLCYQSGFRAARFELLKMADFLVGYLQTWASSPDWTSFKTFGTNGFSTGAIQWSLPRSLATSSSLRDRRPWST